MQHAMLQWVNAQLGPAGRGIAWESLSICCFLLSRSDSKLVTGFGVRHVCLMHQGLCTGFALQAMALLCAH